MQTPNQKPTENKNPDANSIQRAHQPDKTETDRTKPGKDNYSHEREQNQAKREQEEMHNERDLDSLNADKDEAPLNDEDNSEPKGPKEYENNQ